MEKDRMIENPIMLSFAAQLEMDTADLIQAYKEDDEIRRELLGAILGKRNHLRRAIKNWKRKQK